LSEAVTRWGESEGSVEYSKAFKDEMVRKMSPPGERSAGAVAVKTGVPQPTLSRWLREAQAGGMSPEKKRWSAA
jgi:transposase-like protein